MKTSKPKFLTGEDRVLLAKRAVTELYTTADRQRQLIDELWEHLNRLQAIKHPDIQLQPLLDRLGRLREFVNMMETGSFSIAVNQQMEHVWRELGMR